MYYNLGHSINRLSAILKRRPHTMSSERGNVRKNAPRHQNGFKFRHNPNSKKTAQIMKTPIEGLCKRCTDKLEWKKNYRKYKPLSIPRKCTRCEQKTVYRAYHIVCEKCATDLKICAKCVERCEATAPFVKSGQEQQEDKILASLSERKRRTYLRMVERGHTPKIGPNGQITIEIPEEGGSDEESNEDGDDVEGDDSDDIRDDESDDDAPPKPKSAKPAAAAPKKTATSANKANNTKATKNDVKEEESDEDEDEEGEEGSMESFDEDVLDSDDENIVDQIKQEHKQRKQV